MISEEKRKEMILSARLRGLQQSCREIVCQAFREEKPGVRLSLDAMAMLDIWFDEREDFLEDFILHCYDPEWGVQEGVGLCHTFVQRLVAVVAGEWSVRCELMEYKSVPASFFQALEGLEQPEKKNLWVYVWERIDTLKRHYPRIGKLKLSQLSFLKAVGVVFGIKMWMTQPRNCYLTTVPSKKNDAAGKALADAFEQAWRAADPELFS